MAVIQGVPTQAARDMAARMLSSAPELRAQGTGLRVQRLENLRRKREQVYAALQQRRQERMTKKAAEKAEGGEGGMYGGIAGTVLALAAAPFTGGASLAYLPAAATIGSGIGQAIEGQPGGTQTMLQGIGQGAGLFEESDYFRPSSAFPVSVRGQSPSQMVTGINAMGAN